MTEALAAGTHVRDVVGADARGKLAVPLPHDGAHGRRAGADARGSWRRCRALPAWPAWWWASRSPVRRTIAPASAIPPQRFSLVLRDEPNRYGDRPGYRMDLEGTDGPRLDPGPVPGPVIVLHRGEPAEITVVNRMAEPTAIHWHGIEIESYFDGVPGFGGVGSNISPPVAPGQSFVGEAHAAARGDVHLPHALARRGAACRRPLRRR